MIGQLNTAVGLALYAYFAAWASALVIAYRPVFAAKPIEQV